MRDKLCTNKIQDFHFRKGLLDKVLQTNARRSKQFLSAKQFLKHKAKQLNKPWITKGLGVSIKKKNEPFFSGDKSKRIQNL